MKFICLLGLIFVPLFGINDYLLAGSQFTFLMTLRIVCGLYCAFCLCWLRSRHGLFFATYLGITPLLLVGFSIAAMVRVLGGYDSPYYAGLNLVILVVGLIASWSWWETAVFSLVIYLSYLLPALLFDAITERSLFILYNFFLLTTAIFAVVSHIFRLRLEYTNFVAASQIEEKNRQLKQLDRAKSNFLATLTHELTNPLTCIVAPIVQALGSTTGPKVEMDTKMVEIVRRNADRLGNLIGDLLEIARGDVGKAMLLPTAVPDVTRYIEDLVLGMKPLFEAKGIPPDFTAEGTVMPHFFDTKKMDKVITNLLSNALKFTPRGGRISVRIRDLPAAGGEPLLEISVSDTGIGIPHDKLPHVFDRFVQVEEGPVRSYEGMGIGLFLVKDFVEQHGGALDVESEAGKGSTFTVRLPRGEKHFKVPVVTPSSSP